MDNQPRNSGPSEEAGPDGPETDADEAQGGLGPWQRARPPWLQPADVEALAQRFPPLDAAQVRQLAIDFHQGSTPVDLLLLRLVDARLAPAAARQLIADLRSLRDRPGTAPS